MLQDARRGARDLWRVHKVIRSLMQSMWQRMPVPDDDMTITGHLLRIRDPETKQPLSAAQLMPEVATMFFAGFETTGHTAAWTL